MCVCIYMHTYVDKHLHIYAYLHKDWYEFTRVYEFLIFIVAFFVSIQNYSKLCIEDQFLIFLAFPILKITFNFGQMIKYWLKTPAVEWELISLSHKSLLIWEISFSLNASLKWSVPD